MPPIRKALGLGQRRQSVRNTAVPAKKSRKQPVNLLTPNVDSLDNQDAMDTLVDKLVDKLGPRMEALVDRKLRQHAGQSTSASAAHVCSQRSGAVTVLSAAATPSLRLNQLTPPQVMTLQARPQLS